MRAVGKEHHPGDWLSTPLLDGVTNRGINIRQSARRVEFFSVCRDLARLTIKSVEMNVKSVGEPGDEIACWIEQHTVDEVQTGNRIAWRLDIGNLHALGGICEDEKVRGWGDIFPFIQ